MRSQGVLFRYETGDEGTFGRLFVDGAPFCFTAELPWRGNAPNMSCIPPGFYTSIFVPRTASGKFRNVYHVQDVPARSGILAHVGNYAGDRLRGLRTNSWGCILPGRHVGKLNGQKAVLSSALALMDLNKYLKGRPLDLWVVNAMTWRQAA